MIKNDLKQFITLITRDIKKLFEGIEKNEENIKDLIDTRTNSFDDFYIEKRYFRNLFNKYIFNQEDSRVLNHKNQEFRTRYELFDTIFLAEFKDKQVLQLHNYAFNYFNTIFREPQLFYDLCCDIFRKKILYDSKIEEIVEQNLKTWETLFKKHESAVRISLALPKLNIYNDIQLHSDLKITTQQNLTILREGEQMGIELNNLIEYKTKININKESQNQQFEERDRIEAKFTELILSLYLYDFDFKQTNFIIFGPWWNKPYSSDDISKLGAWVGFFKPDISIKQTIELYHKIVKTQIVYNDKLILIAPKGYSIRNTVYLNAGEISPIYRISALRGEYIQWSYRTYDNPFITAHQIGYLIYHYEQTEDSGEFRALEDFDFQFRFRNQDTLGGYLEFDIYLKQDPIIEGFNMVIIVISIITMISLVFVKKIRSLKKK